LRERAVAEAERRIERPQKNLLVGAQEPAALIADPAPDRENTPPSDDSKCRRRSGLAKNPKKPQVGLKPVAIWRMSAEYAHG
jgi:hypothetical protein